MISPSFLPLDYKSLCCSIPFPYFKWVVCLIISVSSVTSHPCSGWLLYRIEWLNDPLILIKNSLNLFQTNIDYIPGSHFLDLIPQHFATPHYTKLYNDTPHFIKWRRHNHCGWADSSPQSSRKLQKCENCLVIFIHLLAASSSVHLDGKHWSCTRTGTVNRSWINSRSVAEMASWWDWKTHFLSLHSLKSVWKEGRNNHLLLYFL